MNPLHIRGRVRLDHPKGWFVVEMRPGGLTVRRRSTRIEFDVDFNSIIGPVLVRETEYKRRHADSMALKRKGRVRAKRDAGQLPLIAV